MMGSGMGTVLEMRFSQDFGNRLVEGFGDDLTDVQLDEDVSQRDVPVHEDSALAGGSD